MMFLLTLAAGGLALATPKDIDRFVTGPVPPSQRRRMLIDALSAPQQRAKGKVRYCFERGLIDTGIPQRVCRTRTDWRRFGLDPLT